MIKISADDVKLFEQNGFTKEQVQATVQHYRELGLSDDAIQEKMNGKIVEFKNTSKSEKEYKEPKLFSKVTNKDIKEYYQNELKKRKQYEKEHPFISSIQKDFAPYYRAEQKEMELGAKYGLNAPIGERIKTDVSKFGQNLIPAANLATAIGTGGMLNGVKGLLPRMGAGAKQGLIQGGVLGLTDSLGDNGLSLDVIPDTLKGGLGGFVVGGGIPLITQPVGKAVNWLLPRVGASLGGVTTDTIKQSIKPNSKALDMNADTAKALLLDTTSNVRNAYNNLVEKAGNEVQDAIHNLRDNKYRVATNDLLNDINSTFDKYQGDYINPVRNMTGKLESNLEDLVIDASDETPIMQGATDIVEDTISPMDLEKAKQQIGSMINWQDESARNFKNPVLEQIYGKFNNRLSELSPELEAANEVYANLKGFKNNEGLRSVLRPGDSIDSASQTLKNYKSTVTKGNTGKNIQDLENVIVENGGEPFLNTIDDINAAMDLENSLKTGRNFLGATDLAKQVLLRPTLRAARWYNSSNLPNVLNKVRTGVGRAVIPFMYNAPRLYGGVSYEDDI